MTDGRKGEATEGRKGEAIDGRRQEAIGETGGRRRGVGKEVARWGAGQARGRGWRGWRRACQGEGTPGEAGEVRARPEGGVSRC